jgi:hypothetical protein
MPHAIRYNFSQSFAVPARKAYLWCTAFAPEDPALMGEENVKRQARHLTDSTVVLKEVFHTSSGDIEKKKLVQLYPERLSWVSTHLTGPNKYSQFIYEISVEGNNASCLNFTALHLEHEKEIMTKADVKLLADKLCKYDSKVWKLLAKAMEKELNK